ncbi:MAG: NAD(P)/FAD-dependent oxidoreductase [Elusimicrobiota bacterium]
MDRIDITIIGAGVIGLAVAARLARFGKSVLVLEKNMRFGEETSSRNSEVIHAGIYYQSGSLKAKMCARGNPLLYEYCRKNGIKHKNLGKIIVAVNDEELKRLENLQKTGSENGARGLEIVDGKKVKELEPRINCKAGMLSPSTGIMDTHAVMQSLMNEAQSRDAVISFDSEIVAAEKTKKGFILTLKKENYRFETGILINCAGFSCDKVAAMCGIDVDKAGYRIYTSKGEYFRIRGEPKVKRLIYPVPDTGIHSLGIHITPDLTGAIRLGPSAYYVDKVDYSIDDTHRSHFYDEVVKFFPEVKPEDLFPDTAGIRPKLQGPNDGFRDFVIRHEADKGLPGLINLMGIESPGFTGCLAIAEYVEEIVKKECPK